MARRMVGWAAGLAGAELGAAMTAWWLWFAIRGDLRGPDFLDYYTAARLQLAAGPARLYDLELQRSVQQSVAVHWDAGQLLLPYLLPPWSALATVPLGLLDYRAAYLVMGVTTLATLAAAVLLLLSAGGHSGRRALLLGALAAGFVPGFVLLVQGQGDGIALLGLGLAAHAWARGHEARAGAFAALTLVKPQLMLLVPLVFLAHRSWPAVTGYASVALSLLLVTLPFFGLAGWDRYLGLVLPWFGGQPAFPLRGQPAFSLGAQLPPWLQLAALGAGAAAVLGWRREPRLDLAFGAAASLLLAPYANAHDAVLLAAPLLLLARRTPILAGIAYAGGELVLGGPGPYIAGTSLLVGGLLALRLFPERYARAAPAVRLLVDRLAYRA